MAAGEQARRVKEVGWGRNVKRWFAAFNPFEPRHATGLAAPDSGL